MLVNINLLKIMKARIIILLTVMLFGTSLEAQTLSLAQCIDTALLYNRNIKLSQRDIYIAKEKYRETRSNLFPKLNGVADYRYYTDLPFQIMPASAFGGLPNTYKEVQFGVAQNLNTNLQLIAPLYNPIVLNAIKSAGLANELSEIQKIKTEEDVVLDVSDTYYNAQILLNQMNFLDSNIVNTQKLVQTTTLLFQQNIAKGTDIDRLKLQFEQISTQRSTVFSQYQQVLNALKFLMGKPITATLKVLLNEKLTAETNYQFQTTTDMLLVDKKLELNYSELRGLRNSKLPSLGAYGLYGTTGIGNTGNNSFFHFHPIGYIGTQLSLPLFNGLITRHKIVQKKIEIDKTNIQKELIAEKSNLEITNTKLQNQVARKNIETITGQIELAKRIYNNTVLQHKQGIATITDLLMADNALREAQQNYILALINLRKAELEYKKVTGNLLKK